MSQEYKVSNAFLSTVSKEDKTPQIVPTKGGDMHKYMVQVENQPIQGWFQILKKPGNEVKPGDVIYGDFVTNQWNKPEFKRAQRPLGQNTTQAPTTQSTPALGGSLEQKVDKILEVVTRLEATFLGGTATASKSSDTVLEDIDDKPVDLSEIPY